MSVKSLHIFMNSLRLVSYENANFGSNIFCRAEGELTKHIWEISLVLEAQDHLPSVWWEKKKQTQIKTKQSWSENGRKNERCRVQKLCEGLDQVPFDLKIKRLNGVQISGVDWKHTSSISHYVIITFYYFLKFLLQLIANRSSRT